MELQDAVIAITGAAQGLGKSCALSLAQRGAKLALLDLNTRDLEACAEACRAKGVEAHIYQCNVANEAEVLATFEQIKLDFSRLDGLINNAGILRDAMLVKADNNQITQKMSLSQWQTVVDVNLTGVFLCGREAAALMIESLRPGCIINISSIARAGNIGQSNYSATKAGVVALSCTWAKELARYGIRAMAVAPGFIETDMTASMPDHAKAHLSKVIPLGKPGQPEHITQAILHILENDYLSGRVIEVDGALRI